MLITPWRAAAGNATATRDTCHYDHPRSHSDNKTARSRRALDMPAQAAQEIGDLAHREGRVTGQVLATRYDYELDAATIRREFRAAIQATAIPGIWSPASLGTPSYP